MVSGAQRTRCLVAGQRGAGPGLGVPETPLPPSVLAEARRRARTLNAGNVLVVRASGAAEARALAAEVAAALDRRPLFLDMDRGNGPSKSIPPLTGLGPFLLLRQLLPVFCFETAPGERRTVPALPGYTGPILGAMRPRRRHRSAR